MNILKVIFNKPKAILFICAFLFVGGIFAYNAIPKQKMPDTTPPMGNYQLIAPGLNSEEMYEYVVKPVEDAILKVDKVDSVVATTYDDFAIVSILLNIMERNPDDVFAQISKNVSEVRLPDGAMKPVFSTDFSFPHAVYSITSDDASMMDVSKMADLLADEISSIKEISSVTVIGQTKEQVTITVEMSKLQTLPITVTHISDILKANGMNIPVGSVTESDNAIGVEVPMLYTDIAVLENIVVGVNPRTDNKVRLREVATVEIEQVENAKKMYANGNQAIFLAVSFQDELDFTKLGVSLTDTVNRFSAEHSGYEVSTLVFQPDYVDNSMNQIVSSLLFGMLFVLIIILIGLGFRNAISVAITFPLIVLTTILFLFGLGEQLQMISIAGMIICIGMIVDNTVVISDAIQHNIDSGEEKKNALILAVKQNGIPIFTSTLTTIVAFGVLMFLPGVAGKMIYSLPLTVSIAVIISYISDMVVVPILGGLLYKKRARKAKKNSAPKQSLLLNKIVTFATKKPVLVTALTFVVLLMSFTLGMRSMSGGSTAIDAEDSVIYINYEYTGDTTAMTAEEYAKSIVDVVSGYEKIEYLAYSVGGDLPRFDSSLASITPLPTTGKIYIRFDMPYQEIDKVFTTISSELKQFEVNGVLSASKLYVGPKSDDLTVNISADDMDKAVEIARGLETQLAGIDKVAYVNVAYPSYQDKYRIHIDREVLVDQSALAVAAQTQIRSMLTPSASGQFMYEGERINIIVKSDIDSMEGLKRSGLLLETLQTAEDIYAIRKIPIEDMSTIEEFKTPYSIVTTNGQHTLSIGVQLADGTSMRAVMGDIMAAIDNATTDDVSIELGGQLVQTADAMTDVVVAGIVAVIVILLLMLLQFNSFKQALIMVLTIPLSYIGCFIAFAIFNITMTTTVTIALVAIMGIAVNAGILLIDYINKARASGMSVEDSCMAAVQRRIRPILLAAAATICGLIQLAITGGAMFTPMAITFIGGVISSTLLSIVVIPALYCLAERKVIKQERIKA